MITLRESIEINANAAEVFGSLVGAFSSSESFKAWHNDHVECQWLNGIPFEVGSVLYVEEYLHKRLHRLKFVSTKLDPDRVIEYKPLFPASIVCTGGSFVIDEKDDYCIFYATLSFRMGWLFSLFAGGRVAAIKKHMKEEGENLKMIVESTGC